MSAISEVNNFMSRKEWIPINRIKVKTKVINSVPVKWLFKSKEVPYALISLR